MNTNERSRMNTNAKVEKVERVERCAVEMLQPASIQSA
jgi:hypothetical protein